LGRPNFAHAQALDESGSAAWGTPHPNHPNHPS